MASNIQALDNSATDNRLGDDFDRRNLDWYIDKIIACVVFICGISAILFVLGIFFFVTKEGIGKRSSAASTTRCCSPSASSSSW
ncbi:MAG: hypothetical protein J5X22_13400 [Candidatus Accumulibacter sp.]|uniref:hypothetical protein n=1 Tax=Accumulibacter sp. TaxID=2053492 RepID=UPI001B27AD63|nr:hypothetical protein [Accumulibacter sp.]MBO3711465.1 hypothetical protein [Accumulibacter sp.]